LTAIDYVEAALDLLGGEDTEFKLSVREDRVLLSCGYGDCSWGFTISAMELWEFVADARDHWETAHRVVPRRL
jgi:hypothetical protein